jgi:hypothetical protein
MIGVITSEKSGSFERMPYEILYLDETWVNQDCWGNFPVVHAMNGPFNNATSKSSRVFFLSVCWIQEDFYRLQLYTQTR